MAAAQLTPPKQWEDWCSWLLGIWLCLSPWVLRFDLQPTETRAAVISGMLIILAEVVTLSAYRAWEEWINVLLGAWLIVAPWVFGIAGWVASGDFIVVGCMVLALALYEMWDARRASGHQT
jgi:SPW repeat